MLTFYLKKYLILLTIWEMYAILMSFFTVILFNEISYKNLYVHSNGVK